MRAMPESRDHWSIGSEPGMTRCYDLAVARAERRDHDDRWCSRCQCYRYRGVNNPDAVVGTLTALARGRVPVIVRERLSATLCYVFNVSANSRFNATASR
jgi:hypothetical protein